MISGIAQAKGIDDVLVSCTNDDLFGGLYVVRGDSDAPERVYMTSCMGLTTFHDQYIVASQTRQPLRMTDTPVTIETAMSRTTSHSIVCLDRDFSVLSEFPVDAWDMGDLHDAVVWQNKLLVVDTLGNRVVRFELGQTAGRGAKPLGRHFMRPVAQWTYRTAVEPDACHVNSVAFAGDRVYVSIFGPFKYQREYERRGRDGQVLDITDGFVPFGSSSKSPESPVVMSNLADPHSLTYSMGRLLLAESRRSRVLIDGVGLASSEMGYLRGLLPMGDHLWMGRSMSRHAKDTVSECALLLYDTVGHQLSRRVALPAREIYTVISRL